MSLDTQAANINGCWPAYAVFQLALEMFGVGGATLAELFPQLVLGPLAEYAQSHTIPLLRNLASHKSGRAKAIPAGQQQLADQIDCFLGGLSPTWIPSTLPDKARGGGWDALLGLLPGLFITAGRRRGRTRAPGRRRSRSRISRQAQ